MVRAKRMSAIVIGLIAVLMIMSGCHKKTPEERAEDVVQHLASKLDLNDSQKARLEKIKHEFLVRRPDMQAMHEDTVRRANAMMRSAQVDQSEVNALITKNGRMLDDYSRFVGQKFTEIHDMLTPEQRNKLVELIEDHMKKHRMY